MLTAGLALLVGSGCASRTARFRPSESSGTGHEKGAAVYYQLEAGGTRLGDAKVWCAGAYPAGVAGKQRMLHVGLRVRNASRVPFRLDIGQTGVELTTKSGTLLIVDDSIRMAGRMEIEPGRLQRFELYFPIPDGVKMEDIANFEFNWALEVGDDALVTSTLFETVGRRRASYAYGPPAYAPYPQAQSTGR